MTYHSQCTPADTQIGHESVVINFSGARTSHHSVGATKSYFHLRYYGSIATTRVHLVINLPEGRSHLISESSSNNNYISLSWGSTENDSISKNQSISKKIVIYQAIQCNLGTVSVISNDLSRILQILFLFISREIRYQETALVYSSTVFTVSSSLPALNFQQYK